MTGKVLVIGDKSKDANQLHAAIRKETHFVCRIFSKDESTGENIMRYKPDLVILCPDRDFEEIRSLYFRLRKDPPTQDLIYAAILNEDELRSSLLPSDLEDVFCRPLRISECISRILILFKKLNRISDKNLIRSGHLSMDVSKYEVKVGERKVDLTYTEYELLKFFVTHPDHVFNRDVLLNKVWGYEYYGGVRTVDVHVRRLRSKIEIKNRKFIDTIRNIGYRFISQE